MIRKITALLTLAIFLSLPAAAQGIPGLSGVGIKGGASIASLRGEFEQSSTDLDNFDYATGFVGGLYGQVEAFPFFTPRLEVLYVQKGGTSADLEDSDGNNLDYNFDYIEIPLLVKLNVPIVNRVFPSVYAGGYYGFLVDSSSDLDGFNDNALKNTDYGLVLGTDVDFTFAGRALTLSGRYDLGLANIIDEDEFDDDANFELNTSTFMVTLGFSI